MAMYCVAAWHEGEAIPADYKLNQGDALFSVCRSHLEAAVHGMLTKSGGGKTRGESSGKSTGSREMENENMTEDASIDAATAAGFAAAQSVYREAQYAFHSAIKARIKAIVSEAVPGSIGIVLRASEWHSEGGVTVIEVESVLVEGGALPVSDELLEELFDPIDALESLTPEDFDGDEEVPLLWVEESNG